MLLVVMCVLMRFDYPDLLFDLFANNPEVLQIFTIAKNEPTVPSVLNKNIICMQRNSYCDWSWNREPFRRTVVQLYFPSGNDWGHHKHSEFCVLALAGCWFHLLPLFHPYLPWVTGWFQWSMNPLIFHGHAIQIHWWNIPVKSHHMDPKWSKHQDTSWKATWPPQMPPFFFWETTINKDDIESPIEYDLGSLVSDVQGRPWWAYRSERRGRAHCDVARHKISTKD